MTWSPWSQGTTPEDWKWQAIGLLCVPGAAFLYSETAGRDAELTQLSLPDCAFMGNVRGRGGEGGAVGK